MPGIDELSTIWNNIETKIKPWIMSKQIMDENNRVKNRIRDCLQILWWIADIWLENSPIETIH